MNKLKHDVQGTRGLLTLPFDTNHPYDFTVHTKECGEKPENNKQSGTFHR